MEILHNVMRKDFSEKVAYEQRPAYRGGGGEPCKNDGKSIPDLGKNKVQDFEVGMLGMRKVQMSSVATIEEQGQKRCEKDDCGSQR